MRQRQGMAVAFAVSCTALALVIVGQAWAGLPAYVAAGVLGAVYIGLIRYLWTLPNDED